MQDVDAFQTAATAQVLSVCRRSLARFFVRPRERMGPGYVSLAQPGRHHAGAIATVACHPTETDYVAVAGGVQTLGLDTPADNTRNTPVASSFPGRMDWDTNTPRENRLDGWIVQFGGNAGAVSDKSPEKAKIWALCVPEAEIPVNQTFSQVG